MIKKKKYLRQVTYINQSIIRQWEYKPHKNPIKNEKKKLERGQEITFLYGKNRHKMGESDKFIVKKRE